MTTRHTISRADELYRGRVHYSRYSPDGRDGIELSHLIHHDFGAVAAADADGVCAAQAVASAGALTMNGALVVGGVATFDVPRALTVVSSSEDDDGQTVTLFGTDGYGETLAETIALNGTTAVTGGKAFATVTGATASAALTGNITVGSSAVLGLPFAAAHKSSVVMGSVDGTAEGVTVVPADADAASATTGDVRGTVTFTTAPDGTKRFGVLMVVDARTKTSGFGVDQYGG
jgi:hypothetical protein